MITPEPGYWYEYLPFSAFRPWDSGTATEVITFSAGGHHGRGLSPAPSTGGAQLIAPVPLTRVSLRDGIDLRGFEFHVFLAEGHPTTCGIHYAGWQGSVHTVASGAATASAARRAWVPVWTSYGGWPYDSTEYVATCSLQPGSAILGMRASYAPQQLAAATHSNAEFIGFPRPHRIYDTRRLLPRRRVAAGTRRKVRIPSSLAYNASNVVVRLTVTQTEKRGRLDNDTGAVSYLHWSGDGQTVGNQVTVAINRAAPYLVVDNPGPGSADLLVDLLGYLR